MDNNANLLAINPYTNQPYTANELAELALKKVADKYAEPTYGTSVIRSGAESVQDVDNTYFDYMSSGYQIGTDNQEARAQLQPWYEQLGNSVAKMGVVAGTTFLDGTAGIVAGIANMANGSQDGNLLNKFIDNPFSNYMLDLQKKAEEALPNYYTQEELESAWYENLGTANFWGDNIIKNMGFAIGALGSGMVASGAASRILGMSKLTKTSDVLRGLTKAVQEGKQLSAAEAAAMRSLGPEDLAKLKNGEVLTELSNVAKNIKSKTAISQASAAFMGSVGEARIEALQNSNEYRDAKVAELDAALQAGDISNEEYRIRKDGLESDIQGMQNGIFAFNLSLLSLSNYAQFKNVFSNGYTPNKVISNEVANLNKTTGLYELAKRGKVAKAIDAMSLLKNPLMEMTEEQGQYAIQKGVEHYTELKNNPDANSTVQNFIKSIGQGLKEAYGTEDGWENAVSGLIIGSTGIPTIGRKSNGKIGLTIGGGIREDYKAQQTADANYKAAVERVNGLLEKNPTRKLYDTMVVDTTLQSMKDESIAKDDRMNAKTLNSMQLANMVDAFVELDKFDDFISLIQDENELSAIELREKYNYKTTSPTTGTEATFQYFRGMDDNEVKDYIKKKSEKAITQAKALRKIKEDIDTRFVNHSADAKKDLFLKAAAVQDIDDRITTLIGDIKNETAQNFYRALRDIDIDYVQYYPNFDQLLTPVDLEQFLNKKKGLENYERLVSEYLKFQTDTAKALEFAEKARDLYGLVKKRQVMNDAYFAMADEEYAKNVDAINAAVKRDNAMTKDAKDRKYAEFKRTNVENDPELGFTSNIFEIDAGKKETLNVQFTDDAGNVTTYKNVRPAQIDEDGNTIFRTDTKGNKYTDYVGTNEKGEEVSYKNVKNPKEEKVREDNKIRLRFAEESSNTLYDEEGNVYNLEDLEQDPEFLKAKVISVAEQKAEIVDKVREQTLKSLINSNTAHGKLLEQQINNLEQSIKEAEDLLLKARANKTQRAAGVLDGVKGVYKVFDLENRLAKHRETLDKLKEERDALYEANNKALGGIKEVQDKNFNRAAFNKAIEEDVAILNSQLARLQDSADQAEAAAKRLEEVIKALKAAIRVIYPKFRKLYQELYGVDPAELNKTGNLTLRSVDPLLKKLRADELALYSQLRVEEAALNDMLQKLADVKQYLDNNKNMVATLRAEQQLLENELAKVFAAIRASKVKSQRKVETAPVAAQEILTEATEATESQASTFVSAKRSVDDTFATAGRHFENDGKINPNVDQQRWFKTIAKVNLAAGQFVLKVFTPAQRPDLFTNVPDELKEDALAVVLYNKGNPVDENLQPLDENAAASELVFSFLPRVVKDTRRLEEMFYDSNTRPEEALAQQEALEVLRENLKQRAAEGKASFLQISAKSVGLLDTTGQKRNPENDLTTSVWDTLLGNGDERSKMANLEKSSIQVGTAKNQDEAEQGIAYISVGGNPVKVKNGLAYYVDEQTGVVIPLLGRKLTGNEVNVVMDLLSARADGIIELATTEEDAAALKAETEASAKEKGEKEKKKKKGGKKGKSKRVFQATRRGAINPITKQKVKWIPSKKSYGYFTYKTEVTKEKAEEVKKAKTVDKLPPILQYISDLIYFGKQTKKDGSLVVSNPKPEREIYLDGWNPATNNYETLTYYDFDKKSVVTIPFTSKSIQDNRASLEKFLANKYLHVRKSKLGEKSHLEALEVVFSEGKPSFVRVHKHGSYKSYLISNKRGSEPRSTEEIPLTTNARTTAGQVIVKSTYLKFPKEPENVKDNPLGGKVTPKKTTAAPTNPLQAKAKEVIDAFQLAINKRDFAPETFKSLMLKVQAELGSKITDIQEEFKRLNTEDIPVDETLYDSLDDASKNIYVAMFAMQQAISNVIMPAAATASPETPDTEASTSGFGEDTSAAESPELAKLLAEPVESSEEEFEEGETSEFDGFNLEDEEEGLKRQEFTGAPQIDIDNAKAWLAKNLPQVPLKIRDKLINGLAQGKVDINGVLHLSNFAEEGTEYHEALHSVMLGILSDEELKEVYAEAKRIYGQPTEQDLADLKEIYPNKSKAILTRIFYDEKLAEDFRTYALSGGKEYPSKKIKTLFEELLDFIKAIIGIQDPVTQTRTSVIDNMFHKLYTGQYAEATYDVSKIKERLGESGSLFRPMNIPNTTLISQGIVTKEVVNAVLFHFFKAIRANNSTMEDFTKTLNTEVVDPTTGKLSKPNLNLYLYQAIRDTLKAMDSLPEQYKTKIENLGLKKLLLHPSKGGLVVNGKSFRDTEVLRVLKEYIQNDLGVDLGLYKEVSEESELDVVDNDSAAWAKDATTINPREGANAYVKLMLASVQDTIRDEDGNLVPAVGIFGLPTLVNPNTLYNHLVQLLHNARSYDEMVKILKANEENLNGTPKFPYLKAVREMLEDPDRLKADPFGAAMLKVNFQQAMYKSALNYKSWLINEDNVVVVDPNSESLDQRIKESWRQGFVASIGLPGSIVVKDKDTKIPVVKKASVDAIVKNALKTHKRESFDFYVQVLNDIGFTLTATDEYSPAERDVLLTNGGYLLSALTKADTELDYVFNKTEQGRIEALARLEAERNPQKTDFQHIGPDGKTRYGITEHNMISTISQFINGMKKGESIQNLFTAFPGLDSVYSENSYLLHNILFENGIRTSAPFKINVIEGSRINKPGEEGEVNTKLTKADRAWISMNSMLKGVFPILRTSDKSLEYALETDVPFPINKINQSVTEYLDVFIGYIKDELNTGKSQDVLTVKNFKKNIGNGLYFFEGILKNKVRDIRLDEDVDSYVEENKAAIKEAILDFLDQHDLKVKDALQNFDIIESLSGLYRLNAFDRALFENINNTDNFISQEQLDTILRGVTVNSIIMNIEQTKMFFGHPAFYKSAVDLYKRTAGAVGTKATGMVDGHINSFLASIPNVPKDGKTVKDGTLKTIVLEEPVTDSDYYEEILKAFAKEYGDEKAAILASKYKEIEEADGQGYITLPEYREFMIRTGQGWSREMEDIYNDVMTDKYVPMSKINKVFNPLKAQYFGLSKQGNTSFPVYLKFSLLPLIPAVYKGTNMEAIAESMMKNGQGVAVYPSGIKLGALAQDTNGNFIEVYDEDGAPVEIENTASSLSLDYRFMGIQVKTGDKVKQETTRGSQQAKLILSNIYADGQAKQISVYDKEGGKKLSQEETAAKVKEYHDTVSKITEQKAQNLLNEIGAVEESKGVYKIKDVTKLAKVLKAAARRRNSPDNLIDAFDLKSDGTVRLKYLLDAVPGRNKIENILFSLINNELISQKYYGGTRIQAAGTLFEKAPRERHEEQDKTIVGNLRSNPDLKFYRKGKYGETLPAQVKLSPNKEQALLIKKLGGLERTNALLKELFSDANRYNQEKVLSKYNVSLDPAIFQFVAYRIPTQGVNTIEYMEIVEFLDPLNGEAIQLPSEIAAKSGGDYDIDKLNVYFKHFNNEGKLIKGNDLKGLHNKLVQLNQDFLASEEYYTELLIPNVPVTIQELASEMARINQTVGVNKTDSLTWLYNLEVAENYLVGKAAVGIVARHITHHTLAQQVGLKVNEVYEQDGEQVKTNLNFEGSENNYSLAREKDIQNGNKINHIISEFLSAFVDIGKDPFVVDIGGSTKTADLYMYLLRRGVPINQIVYFMNQPVIKEYYKRLATATAMFKEGKSSLSGELLTKRRKEIIKSLIEQLSSLYASKGGELSKISSKVFSEEGLKNNLGLPLISTDISFIRDQYNILKDFLRYSEQADNLRVLMDATSQDTTRVKNFNSLDNMAARMYKVVKTGMFDLNTVEKDIFNKTFLGAFKKAQGTSAVFRDLFITENPTIAATLDTLRSYLVMNEVNEEDMDVIMDKAKNDIIVQAVSSYYPDIPGGFQKELFIGDKTMAKRVAATLRSPSPAVRNSPFYKNIYPLIENLKSNVEGLKMFNVKLSTFDFNQLVNAFRSIKAKGGKYEVSNKDKRDLAFFALLQSGLDNSPITWFDKVPIEITSAIITPALANYARGENSLELQGFIHQFIKNNYSNSNLVPYVGYYRTDGKSKSISIDSTGTITLPSWQLKRYGNAAYVKVTARYPEYNEDTHKFEKDTAAGVVTSETLLFAKVGDGKYKLVNKLGDKMYMKEYNKTGVSFIKANNVAEGKFAKQFPNWSEPNLPTIPTETGYDAYRNACN